MAKIGVNSLALRQTADSKYSHFSGTWDELIELVSQNFEQQKSGYRDGVVLVPLPADGFFSGVVELAPDTPLRAVFSARRKGEDPYVQINVVGGEKLPAAVVEVVCYRRDVLLEEGPDAAASGAEWEIVSINARATEEPEPLTPVSMARNFLGFPGGTKAEYSAEEFARAIMYWSRRAMRG